jgi:uncharacterized membrane protein YedE/YeeE
LIGLILPLLLLYGAKLFGISSSLRHLCAATGSGRLSFFRYDWKREGLWNLAFVAGIVLGGFFAGTVLATEAPIAISTETWNDLSALGVARQEGMAPVELFTWERLATLGGFVSVVLGGFLLGLGARWAGGCTSGHAISGLADRQLPSLVAVVGFFAGGLLVTHLVLPLLMGVG